MSFEGPCSTFRTSVGPPAPKASLQQALLAYLFSAVVPAATINLLVR